MKQQVLEIIARIAEKDVNTLTEDMELVKDLSIDSPKALELLCDMEDILGIELPDEAIANTDTVADLLALIPVAS